MEVGVLAVAPSQVEEVEEVAAVGRGLVVPHAPSQAAPTLVTKEAGRRPVLVVVPAVAVVRPVTVAQVTSDTADVAVGAGRPAPTGRPGRP